MYGIIHKDDHAPIAEIIRSTKDEIGKWPNYAYRVDWGENMRLPADKVQV